MTALEKTAALIKDYEDLVLNCLEEDKAENILAIDLKGKSSLADTMIIASGRSKRHVGALADHIVRKLKSKGLEGLKPEGIENCDWVLIDTGDLVIHIFRPEVREFYNLERLWTGDVAKASQ